MKAQLLTLLTKSAVVDAGIKSSPIFFNETRCRHRSWQPGDSWHTGRFRSIYRKSCASCCRQDFTDACRDSLPLLKAKKAASKVGDETKKEVTLQWHQRWTLYFTISWPDTASVRDLGLWIDGFCCPFILPWLTLPICCTARCFETQDQLEKRIGECFWLVSLLLNVLPLGDKVTCTFW